MFPEPNANPSLAAIVGEYARALPVFSDLHELVRKKKLSHADAHKQFLDEHDERFPSLAAMDKFQLVTSSTSAQDERYIAASKLVKTLPRNRMKNSTLNACMQVKFNDCAIDYEQIAENLPVILE